MHREVRVHRDVGALELAGRREHVRRELGELAVDHVDHDQRVEPAQRGAHAVGFGERRDRVPTGDEQRPDVAGLDLVGEGDRGDLVGHSRQIGTTRGPGPRRSRRAGRAQVTQRAPGNAHASGRVQGPGRDEQHPPQPLDEDAVGAHERAGTARDRQAPAMAAQVVGQCVERRGIDGGRARGARDRERGQRVSERLDVGRHAVLPQLGLVGAARQYLPCQRGKHEHVGAGTGSRGVRRPARRSPCAGDRSPTGVRRFRRWSRR